MNIKKMAVDAAIEAGAPTPTESAGREALAGLSAACPSELDCYAFHHAKPDQHEYEDTCQPKQRYEQALAKAAAALATGGRHD